VTSIRDDGVQLNLEAGGQLDLLQICADGVGILAFLRDHGDVQVGRGDLHLLKGREIVFARLGKAVQNAGN